MKSEGGIAKFWPTFRGGHAPRRGRRPSDGATQSATVECPACGARSSVAGIDFHVEYDCPVLSERRTTGAHLAAGAEERRTRAHEGRADGEPVEPTELSSGALAVDSAQVPNAENDTAAPLAFSPPAARIVAASPSKENAFGVLMESQHPALCCLVAGGNVNATTTPGATSPTNRSACPVFTWAFVPVAAHQTWREACAAALPPHLQPCIRMGEAHLPHAFFGTSFEAPPDSVLPVTARCTVLFLLAPGMPGEHAPLHRRSKRSRRRSTSPPPASPPLSRSVLLSALQKCIRRGRVLSAVRLAHTIYQAHGMAILTRRLLVITVEDGLLHPAAPLLAWYMGASTKGYRVSTADVDAVLQYVAEVATVRERDTRVEHRFSTVESFQRAWRPYESAFRLRLDVPQQALVAALFLRSLYGGMHGDQRMLREYALEWTRRFLSEVPPPETVSERVLKSETRDMCGTSDRCATWYVTPGTSCPWIRFLELSYTRTRQALQRRVPDGVCVANIGPLTVHDIPLAAIGPYSGIRLPSEDAARGTVWGAVYDAVRRYAPNTDPVDALSSLVWHLRSKLNVRRDMWCAPASSEARAAAADDDDDDSDQQVPPFPHFQNTEQAACWRLVAPVLERAARAYLRRRFRPAFADTSPTT